MELYAVCVCECECEGTANIQLLTMESSAVGSLFGSVSAGSLAMSHWAKACSDSQGGNKK